MYDAAFTKL